MRLKAPASRLRDLVRIERPITDDSFDGAGAGTWILVAEVYAAVQPILPSRGEKLAEGMTMARRPARLRIRYRDGIDAAMRIIHRGRILQIIAGPAEIGRRELLEMMVEDYSTEGQGV